MKVIAFKIYEQQKLLIHSMVRKGFYPSFSEAVRTACWELLEELLVDEDGVIIDGTDRSRIEQVLLKNEKFLKVDSSLSGAKVATSAKFPMKILRKIDDLVRNYQGFFKNRSEFIRYASSVFLMTDSEIYSVFLEQPTSSK